MNLVTRVNPPLVKCAGRRCCHTSTLRIRFSLFMFLMNRVITFCGWVRNTTEYDMIMVM